MKVKHKRGRSTLPRFTIIGLPKGQESHVAKRCAHLAAIRFVNWDRLPHRMPNSDHVILVTKFLNHRSSQITAICRQSDVILHYGGISSLGDLVIDLARGSA